MVVAGAPEKTKYHAHNICDMALDMVRSIDHLKDPSNGNNIQIRVGGLDIMLMMVLDHIHRCQIQGQIQPSTPQFFLGSCLCSKLVI